MQLIPILLIICYALYNLMQSAFWLVYNHTPLKISLIRGIFGGLFPASIQFVLSTAALIVAAIVLIAKQYSSKSIAVAVTVLAAVMSISSATYLATSILFITSNY